MAWDVQAHLRSPLVHRVMSLRARSGSSGCIFTPEYSRQKKSQLIRKMIVQRPGRNLRFFSDVAQRCGMEAGEREFFQRYHDQVHALLLGSL